MTDQETIIELRRQIEFKNKDIKQKKALIEGYLLILQSDATPQTKVDLLTDEIGGIVWGCTDTNSTNYDRNATQNDSSCAYIA